MPINTDLEWECVKLQDDLRSRAGAHPYLMYFVAKSGKQGASADAMDEHWGYIASDLRSRTRHLIPLCAATKDLASGGTNWTRCLRDRIFPDGNDQTPHAIWFMTSPDPLTAVYADGFDHRYSLDSNGRITLPASDVKGSGRRASAQAKQILDKPILAQAIAVEWLLSERPCATAHAIRTGFCDCPSPSETPAALPPANAAKDI